MFRYASAFALLLAAVLPAQAADEYFATVATLIERVDRLEKRLSGSALTEMAGQSEQLRSDLSLLRGDMEQLTHDLEELKRQQREQYLDLDKRLQALSGGAPVNKPVPLAAGTDAPAAPAGPAQETVADAETVKQAYLKAFNSMKEGRYKDAIGLFKGFLASYAGRENADNAQYWLGEAYYVTQDFAAAQEAFRKLQDNYPKSPKVAQAQARLQQMKKEGH
ncbi:MAG: outer membrane protein assembly factor BamD [Methylococcaceae bacterium]|nr:MAG: outer membrane protein assembly factor BamD [Methylococcaceae bacterium]